MSNATCTHGLVQRNKFGTKQHDGLEVCLGCKLPTAESVQARGVRLPEANHLSVVLSTLPWIPGRDTVEVLGLVHGMVVQSRHVFSDIGSDLKSGFGGRLAGIEKALSTAYVQAEDELRRAGSIRGADAVLGVDFSVQTVADKAQLITLVGTAVKLSEDSAGVPGPEQTTSG